MIKGFVTKWVRETLLEGRFSKAPSSKILHLDNEPVIGNFCIEVLSIVGKTVELQLITKDQKGNIYAKYNPVFLTNGGTLEIEDYKKAFNLYIK